MRSIVGSKWVVPGTLVAISFCATWAVRAQVASGDLSGNWLDGQPCEQLNGTERKVCSGSCTDTEFPVCECVEIQDAFACSSLPPHSWCTRTQDPESSIADTIVNVGSTLCYGTYECQSDDCDVEESPCKWTKTGGGGGNGTYYIQAAGSCTP